MYKDIERRGRALTVVVTLQPGAARGFVRYPVHELTDTAVPAHEVLVGEPDHMIDRLDAAVGLQTIIRILQEELGHLAQHVVLDLLVQEAIRRIARQREGTVASLARALGVSERRLRERFGRYAGLSPKRFARISRVERVLDQLPLHSTPTWGRVAHQAGYADHSHMIREFNEMLGETPELFAARVGAGP